MKMLLPMLNGPEKDCQQKQNGNLQQGGERRGSCIPGVMYSGLIINGWRILIRVSFHPMTKVRIAIRVLHRLCNFLPMHTGCMIWPGMYGNGVTTGIGRTTTNSLQEKK